MSGTVHVVELKLMRPCVREKGERYPSGVYIRANYDRSNYGVKSSAVEI
jgi:hypothetical protein